MWYYSFGKVNIQETSLRGIIMAKVKVRLKKGEKLSSNNNFSGLNTDVWTALNQGKEVSVEEESIPKLIVDQITQTGQSDPVGKGGK